MNTAPSIFKTQSSFMKNTFLVSGIGFLLVCFIGYMTSLFIDSQGIIKDALDGRGRFDMDIYKNLGGSDASLSRLGFVSIGGIVMILLSSILNMVWAWRFNRASKPFIFIVFGTYIIGQGIGFGILFATWKAVDLLSVFGIAGGMFLAMGLIGWFSKNLMPLWKYLVWGSIISFVLMGIFLIMSFMGVYNDTLFMILWSFSGFLILGWIAFDIWRIKVSSAYFEQNGIDPDMKFRLTMWYGFRLLSDLIALIWIIARFYRRMK